jgi:AAA domain-containing protein
LFDSALGSVLDLEDRLGRAAAREMPLVSLQERLRIISAGLGAEVSNRGFRILAADQTENGISLGTEDGQQAIEPLLSDVDLLILDNLSTLCTTGSESASDAWVPMQNWLLGLRRKGVAVLLVHHAGTKVDNAAHRVGRMHSIQLLRYDALRITHPNKVRVLRCISRNFAIVLMATVPCHSKRPRKA